MSAPTSPPPDSKAVMAQALLQLREVKARLAASEQARREPIALVGMGCRFPAKVSSPDALWARFRDGVDAVTEIPRERFDVDAYFHPSPGTPGRIYTRHGAFLDAVDAFEPQFFGIAPREASSMDPQQRLLLEVCWEALESSGHAPSSLSGTSTGVFVGMCSDDYFQLSVRFGAAEAIDTYSGPGTSRSVAAGRIAYLLGLHGPALQVDTSCSSSLMAVHLACQSLRAGDCDVALAGGVHLVLSPLSTLARCKVTALSPDGRCRAFDARANGFVQGEGCGVVVLKRLSDALAANDRVLAVIRGSAANHNGRSNGLTAPSEGAQEALLLSALRNAGVTPREVSYVEAHGTGTSLGDPIEIGALRAVFAEGRSSQSPLLLGSAKTNFGHLEAAAGVLSLMKVVLALEHEQIPPHLHLTSPNPHIPWDELPFRVPREGARWARGEQKRIAGVSSFGMSGTNVHLLVEEPPAQVKAPAEGDRPVHLLTLSARNEEAVRTLAGQYRAYLDAHPDMALADVCYTAATGRNALSHRVAAAVRDVPSALAALEKMAEGRSAPGLARGRVSPGAAPRCAFLFTGQGSQYAGMGLALYDVQPVFREALDACAAVLDPLLGRSLLAVLRGEAGPLEQTSLAQPTLFALEYALARLFQSWGVEPMAVLGHSVGEYVAACLSGVFPLEDGLRLIAARGRLMQALPEGGAMAAVFAEEEAVAAAAAPWGRCLSLAAINGPRAVVVSGEAEAIAELSATLTARGAQVTPLKVAHAFHSALIEAMLPALEEEATRLRLSAPRLPLVSNVTGGLAGAEVATPTYWSAHARAPVRFAAGVETLRALGCDTFLELGPKETLTAFGRATALPSELWQGSLRRGAEWEALVLAVGALHVRGLPVDLAAFDAPHRRRRVALPTYPFQRSRFWSAAAEEATMTQGSPSAVGVPPQALERLLDEVSGLSRKIAGLDRRLDALEGARALAGWDEAGKAPPSVDAGSTPAQAGDGANLAAPSTVGGVGPDGVKRLGRPLTVVGGEVARRPAPGMTRSPTGATAGPPSAADPTSSSEGSVRGTRSPFEPTRVPEPESRALNSRQQRHLEAFIARYNARTGRSKGYRTEAVHHCNNRRSSAGFRFETKELLYPIVAVRSEGAHFWDLDGNRYVDLAMGYGANLFGHRPPFVQAALERQLRTGMQLGAEAALAGEVSRMICEATGMDRALFNNSGTEAVMTALRIARASTLRPKIALFTNAYHGHFDGTLVIPSAPHGASWARPMAVGTPAGMTEDTLVLPFDDPRAFDAIREHAHALAAVIVEPVQNRRPDVHPQAFLLELRRLTRELGIVLIFDEILVGFRIHRGGAQRHFGVEADMATYGKVVGGGMPIGVVAGKATFMDRVDGGPWTYGDRSYPEIETTYSAGTFSKHPMAMAAAHAVLSEMESRGDALHSELNACTAGLASRMNGFFESQGVPIRMVHFGSFFRFAYQGNLSFVYQPLEIDLFFYHLIDRGVYVWEGRTCFLSTAHGPEEVDHIFHAAQEAVREMREGGFWEAAGPKSNPAAHGAPSRKKAVV